METYIIMVDLIDPNEEISKEHFKINYKPNSLSTIIKIVISAAKNVGCTIKEDSLLVMPLSEFEELDVSDCNLVNIMARYL